MKTLSKAAAVEIRELTRSTAFKKDMDAVTSLRHNPFVRAGVVDVDAYIDFVSEFNAFINHEQRRFEPMKDPDMRL